MELTTANLPRIFGKLAYPNSTGRVGVVGSLLCWLALPPLNWSWLVWFAPLPWLILVRIQELPGRRPYRWLWLAGVVYWLLAVHWIRLPHPMNYLAWTALATYLGIYLPTFITLSRVGVHRFQLPLVLVAPIVWTGLDWLRGHLLTGFLMGSLAHTQYRTPLMIQLADVAGEYGVTYLIMLVAATIESILFEFRQPRCSGRCSIRIALISLPGAVAFTFATIYGFAMQLKAREPGVQGTGPRIALIQGNTPADWKMDAERQQEIMQEYGRLSREAVRQSLTRDGRTVDLVIWPETSFRQNLISVQEGFTPPPGRLHESILTAAKTDLAELVRQVGCAVLVGLDRIEIVPSEAQGMAYRTFNSAVLVDKSGQITATYDKMHRVVFGEYIPFAEWFPFLYRLTPLTGGIVAGASPAQMWLGDDTLLSPNICYETVVPHLIRQQWQELFTRTSIPPRALINLTNDAWFWGSSELDMHLACGVFRAVETHTPLLIAANGGLSAFIDDLGNIRQVSTRQQTATLLVDLDIKQRSPSLYTEFGDWFAVSCVLCCLILALAAIKDRLQVLVDHRAAFR